MKESDDEIVPVKDVNPIGYIAGGNLDFNKRPRPRPPKKAVKSLWVAYLLWLVGGWWALHLLYLRRDRQAFIWLTTFGGFFGVGVLRDFFRIPSYVKDINEDNQYVAELIAKMKTHSKPPFTLLRFAGQILVGNYWSTLLAAVIPTEEIFGMKWTILTYLAPIGEALAVWTIGNIGHEQGELKWAMIGAIVVVPFSVFYPPVSNWSSIISAVLFEWKGKKWQRTPSKIPPCKRLMTFSGCLLIFSSLWISALYFNASVTDENGESIKLRDAVKNFLNSPMFLQFKENFKLFINNAMENGWGNAWRILIEALDPHGIKHSLKVLGLQKNATKEEIKLTFKKLAKEWHPDRHGEDKEAAHKKFIEIREAYEKLSAYVNRRSHRNKQ